MTKIMKKLPVKFTSICLPASPDATYEAEDIELVCKDLPHVPSVGDMVKVTPQGDYMEVVSVYVDYVSGEGIDIQLDTGDDLRPWKEMQAEGWTQQ